MTKEQQFEREFINELTRQTNHYQQTLEIAQRIQSAIHAEKDFSNELIELGQQMSVVSDLRSRATEAERQWKSLGLEASPSLRAAYSKHESTLKQLVDTVRASEDLAQTAKSKLQPQLDSVARDRKVVQRYGDAARL